MKLNLDTPTDDAQVQLIPLIDVIFCILTFFILASLQLTRKEAINVDLPKASTGTVQMREMLVVTIDSTGQTFIEKQLVDRAQLYQILQNYRQQRPDGLLVLNASQTAFYNDVIQVLDILRSVGGDRVALATIPNSSTPVAPSPGLPGLTPPASPNPLNPNPLNPDPLNPGSSNLNPTGPTLPGTPTTPDSLQVPATPGQSPVPQSTFPANPGIFPAPLPTTPP